MANNETDAGSNNDITDCHGSKLVIIDQVKTLLFFDKTWLYHHIQANY